MRNRSLHEALTDFPLAQTGGELTFLQRHCRENDWTLEYGRRAIGEYKRFVYLAMVSTMPVTPSGDIDQVWHLHLLYTRSYWEDLQAILGRPFHHGPTAGGQAEDTKYENWYERTKALYESEFGTERRQRSGPPRRSGSIRASDSSAWMPPCTGSSPSPRGNGAGRQPLWPHCRWRCHCWPPAEA